MTLLVPLICIYIAARLIDWMITGGNHVDGKISVKLLVWILVIVFNTGLSEIFRCSRLHCSPGRACTDW